MRPDTMSLSKSKRFKVFDRDGYKCRYCGRTPEDSIILEVDHVIPISKGGGDVMENLVTSCFECNRGKSAIEIGSVAPESDADRFRRLQETAELERAAEELREITERKKQLVQEWANTICGITGEKSVPTRSCEVCARLSVEFSAETVTDWAWIAFDRVEDTGNNFRKYIHGIARKTRETAGKEVPVA